MYGRKPTVSVRECSCVCVCVGGGGGGDTQACCLGLKLMGDWKERTCTATREQHSQMAVTWCCTSDV
jgi:hypothetical protein